MPEPPEVPWFAGRPGDFLLFRVNRRPLTEDNLLAPGGMPDNVFEHFGRVLAPGYTVVTGRRHQRTWRVGGVSVSEQHRVLYGKLGWLSQGEEAVPVWSETEKDWISSPLTPQGGRVVPFGFDGDTRLLAVLSDRRSPPGTVASVFEKILRDNEAQLLDRTTDWSVEPILDSKDFLTWLATLDVVTSVSFTARLPNPEPRDAFRDLTDRMSARRATHYTETMRSEREEGLIDIDKDQDFKQAIAMGGQGFATLRGKGQTGGSPRTYSQAVAVAKEHVDGLPSDWGGMWRLLQEFLKDRLRSFLNETDQS